MSLIPAAIHDFLAVETPLPWLEEASRRVPELLHDHANCELKAASTALGLIYRYPEKAQLADRMSRLAREELRHFEQVRKLMAALDIPFQRTTASRYASALRKAVRDREPGRLIDMLIVGALIEARSCERFAALLDVVPDDISGFYRGLLASESRHFRHYLQFAREESGTDDNGFEARVAQFKELEADLVTAADPQFRFHSGVPVRAA